MVLSKLMVLYKLMVLSKLMVLRKLMVLSNLMVWTFLGSVLDLLGLGTNIIIDVVLAWKSLDL